MAKNKLTVILLSVAAVAIWGIVGYRVFRWVAPKDMPIAKAIPPKTSSIKPSCDSLKLNYRDPFLSDLEESRPMDNHARFETPAPEPVMPVLSYKGLIRDGNGIVRALITCSNQTEGYRKGESVAGVRIMEITADCLTVKWRGKTYTIAAQ